MPQWRKLHTKITESLDFHEMPDDFTRLVWVLLPLGLDREGRSLDNASLVRARIMPLRDDVSSADIRRSLDWFITRGMLEPYEVGGRKYFYLPTFAHYQGDTRKEAASVLPAPPEAALDSAIGTVPGAVPSPAPGHATDVDVDADAEISTTTTARARENDDGWQEAHQALERAGVIFTQPIAEVWQVLHAEYPHALFLATIQEAAVQGIPRLSPVWAEAVMEACMREGRLPGKRRKGLSTNDARASPTPTLSPEMLRLSAIHDALGGKDDGGNRIRAPT